jgi:hypothetical protein
MTSFGVTALYEDSRGNLWLGAANGFWRWRPGPPDFYPLPGSTGRGGIFTRKAILEGDGGGLVISGAHGITQFVNKKMQQYPLPPESVSCVGFDGFVLQDEIVRSQPTGLPDVRSHAQAVLAN